MFFINYPVKNNIEIFAPERIQKIMIATGRIKVKLNVL